MFDTVGSVVAWIMGVIGALVTIFSFWEHLSKRPALLVALRRTAVALTTAAISTVIGSLSAVGVLAWISSQSPVNTTFGILAILFVIGCFLYGGALGAVYGLRNFFQALGLLTLTAIQVLGGITFITFAIMLIYTILAIPLQFVFPAIFKFWWSFLYTSIIGLFVISIPTAWAQSASEKPVFADAKYFRSRPPRH